MKLRSQMLLAGAMTLIVPLVGWQSVKQLYVTLQQTRIDEQILKAANMRLALSESSIVSDWLAAAGASATKHDWYAEKSSFPVFVDGYDDDWKTLGAPWYVYSYGAQEPDRNVSRVEVETTTTDDQLSVPVNKSGHDSLSFRVATQDNQLYLFIKVRDNALVYHRIPYLPPDAGEGELPDRWYRLVNGDSVEIAIEQGNGYIEHGLFRAVAPGPIEVVAASDWQQLRAGDTVDQWHGFWSRTVDGFQLEVSLPLPANGALVGLAVVDIDTPDESRNRWVGNTNPADMASRQADNLGTRVLIASEDVRRRLESWTTDGVRARVFDKRGWLVADVNKLYATDEDDAAEAEAGSFNGVLDALLLRVFSLMVADDLPLLPEPRTVSVTLNLSAARREAVSDDQPLTSRYVTDENDRVLGTLAPIGLDPARGYLLLEANEEHASAYAGSQLARLFSLLLLVSLMAGFGLLIFAMVLSSRIRRLSHDAQQAISVDGRVKGLAGSDAQDEIGDLSRRLASLLSRSAQYTDYLEALSGRLSHELRTPLSVVRTSLENLDLENLDTQSRMLIDRAQGGANQLGKIIKALMDSTRLEHSVQGAMLENVDLSAWLHSSLDIYQQIYPGVQFRVLPAVLPKAVVNISPELLQQAMDKLVDNAVSFSSDGTVLLQLSIGNTNSAPVVNVSVANRGHEIDESEAVHWFDPLVSLRQEPSPDLHLGLGLYIVRLIAHASGGDVFARNQSGWIVVGLSLPLT